MTMKLSEAIRAGKKWEDTRSQYVLGKDDRNTCKACAIGGALLAALGDDFDLSESYATIKICNRVWPDLKNIKLTCPEHGTTDSDGHESTCTEDGYEELDKNAQGNPFEIASHLFSDHKWSKDVVADWVAKEVESKLS